MNCYDHAPGPWSVTPQGGIAFSGSAGFELTPWGNSKPIDSHLLRAIAATPRLIEALQNMVGMFDNPVVSMKLGPDINGMRGEACKSAREVLREAIGQDFELRAKGV